MLPRGQAKREPRPVAVESLAKVCREAQHSKVASENVIPGNGHLHVEDLSRVEGDTALVDAQLLIGFGG